MPGKDHGRCLVCDDIAIGINFGVPTCMPCKAFFRRNAVKLGTYEFSCRSDGNCIISYRFRRSCNCCRLAKCFRVGMKRSLILSDDKREARNKLVAINRLKRGRIPIPEYLNWIQIPSLSRTPSISIERLAARDQTLLNNVYSAYENTCALARNTKFLTYASVEHKSMHGYLNEISPTFQALVEFLKHVPEFRNLIISDKIRLIRNHFGILLNFNEHMLFSATPSNLIVTWRNLFSFELTKRLFRRNQVLDQFIFDPIILKLVVIILTLSTDNSRNIDYFDMNLIYEDTLSIFAAQNTYVELLWKYILVRSANEQHAVKAFNRLLMCMLYVQDLDIQVDAYVCSLTEEIKQTEPMVKHMYLGIEE